jgi:hypothetical protein
MPERNRLVTLVKQVDVDSVFVPLSFRVEFTRKHTVGVLVEFPYKDVTALTPPHVLPFLFFWNGRVPVLVHDRNLNLVVLVFLWEGDTLTDLNQKLILFLFEEVLLYSHLLDCRVHSFHALLWLVVRLSLDVE